MGNIDLTKFGAFGIVLFITILFIFECLFCIIGYYISSYLKLTGFVWWIVTLAIISIGNMLFLEIN